MFGVGGTGAVGAKGLGRAAEAVVAESVGGFRQARAAPAWASASAHTGTVTSGEVALLGALSSTAPQPFAEANRKRNRTAKLGNRDKRDQLPAIGPELGVSGSDSPVPPSQDPAKTREFLGWSRGAGAKSLQQQTSWRCSESGANPSPEAVP